MSKWSPDLHYTCIDLLLVLSACHIFGVDALVADNACSSRLDGRCTKCDGVPQCFDLSDEIGCSNTTMKLVPIQQAVPACQKKTCPMRFPEPPPLPPFSLCDGNLKSTTTTQSPTHKSTTIKTTHVPTNTWPTRPTSTWQPESTTRWPVYKTTTVTPPWSTTQWMPTSTSTKSNTPSFMEVFWFCSSRQHQLTNILDCVMRIFRCYRPVGCRGLSNNVTPPPDLTPTQLFSTHSPFDHVTTVPHNLAQMQLYPASPPTTNIPDYYYNTEQPEQQTQNDMAYFMLLGKMFSK